MSAGSKVRSSGISAISARTSAIVETGCSSAGAPSTNSRRTWRDHRGDMVTAPIPTTTAIGGQLCTDSTTVCFSRRCVHQHAAPFASVAVTMARRPCLDCGLITDRTTRCSSCSSLRNIARHRRRTHYQGDYRQQAAQVRANATVCWLCGEGPREGDPWQADHVLPATVGSPLAPAHRSCNASRGNRPAS